MIQSHGEGSCMQSRIGDGIQERRSFPDRAGLEERRFNVLDVSDAKMQDHEYFKAIVDQMHNGGIEAMLGLVILSLASISFFPTYQLYSYHFLFSRKEHLKNLAKSFRWSFFTIVIVFFSSPAQI